MINEEKNYKLVFEKIVLELGTYLVKNNIKAMVLGISGGIDSTVCSIICREVSKRYGIRSIGVSMPLKNKPKEVSTAKKILENIYEKEEDRFSLPIRSLYDPFQKLIWNDPNSNHEIEDSDEDRECTYEDLNIEAENQTPLLNGNIMARIRMILLYNLAGRYKGIVIDTDNLTEHYLGFFTIHGDQGDYKPIGNLWKTEVYQLADWMLTNAFELGLSRQAMEGLKDSDELTPTDGNGVSSSDLEQIGGNSYEEVDVVLKNSCGYGLTQEEIEVYNKIPEDTRERIRTRHKNSEFKRQRTPTSQTW